MDVTRFLLNPGSAIRSRRKELAISQKTLAAKSAVHWNSIAKFERGEGKPSLDTLAKILNAFQTFP